jgi:hypothetical protein
MEIRGESALVSGRAEEYADPVPFLVGNDDVNGETIRIDGAHRLGLK